MGSVSIEGGVVHELPDDIRQALVGQPNLIEKWNNLTELARNEWICWTTIVKKDATRQKHVQRLVVDVGAGKKRPCCWPGCPHRNDKAKKYFK